MELCWSPLNLSPTQGGPVFSGPFALSVPISVKTQDIYISDGIFRWKINEIYFKMFFF